MHGMACGQFKRIEIASFDVIPVGKALISLLRFQERV